MGSNSIILLGFLLLSCFGFSRVMPQTLSAYQESVRTQCGFTRYPALCVQTLAGLGINNKNVDLLSALVNKTISESSLPESFHDSMTSSSLTTTSSETDQSAIAYCKELMKMSTMRLNQALKALQTSPQTRKADIQTWLSAAVTYHETCKDAIVEENLQSDPHASRISAKMDYLSQLVSNPLALANRITRTPRMPTRRLVEDGFPDWVPASQRRLLQAPTGGINANAVVAQDGSGNYKTVGEAIAAAGGGRFVIYVKAGTYNEVVNTKKSGITLIGDGKDRTVITAGKSVGGGTSLRGSATFTISGDGFIAKDIGFDNSAGAASHQAVALNVVSDRAALFRCRISGYQDSLYAHSLRQFYRECDIYGTVDFIFGNAAAVFQRCTMNIRRPRSGGAFNTVLANGRSDPGQNTGFSLHTCTITVAGDFAPVKGSYRSYLGRPWKAYSRAVVMQSSIDGEIEPKGWIEWEGASGSTYRTLYFAEYQNMGPGAGTSGRVGWPGFHVIATPEASKFTVANFIGGNAWLPSTGVAYTSGL